MFYRIAATPLLLCLLAEPVTAGLIQTIDFTDGNWDITFDQNAAAATNESTFGATFLTADEAASGGSNSGVRITATLNGSISTVGFENISIAFDGDANGGLEWNGNLSTGVANTDGLRIFGDGVDINANSSNDITGTDAEDDFDNGSSFPTANFNTGFSFSALVDNSAINDLQFVLQVNASTEELTISNVRILGDAIPSPVPEPSTMVLMMSGMLATAGLRLGMRRRQAASWTQ